MVDLAKQNFEVNLNDEGGAKILKSSINAIFGKGEDENLEWILNPCVYQSASEKVGYINGANFNLIGILEQCQ